MPKISTFASAYAKQPFAAGELTWDELRGVISEMLEVEATHGDKRTLPVFVPYETDARGNASAEEAGGLSCVVIDIDHCLDLPGTCAALDTTGAPWIVYTTPSDDSTAAERRIRVIVGVDADIPPEACAHTRKALAEMLGYDFGSGVEACLDPARLSFCGRLPSATPREIWSGNFGGLGLDAAELIARPLRGAWRATAAAPTPPPLGAAAPGDAGLTALLAPAYELGNRHAKCRAIGGYLARQGWDDARIVALVGSLPSDQVPARVRQALDAAHAARDGRIAPGWAELTREFGPGIAAACESIVRAPAEAFAAKALALARVPDYTDPGSEFIDWLAPETPINWLVKGLALGPSEDKISIIGGAPSAGKGPLAGMIALCVAMGVPMFGGAMPVDRQANVLVLDFEGASLTARRIKSFANGLGIDHGKLPGRLFLRRTSAAEVDDILANPDNNWLTQLCERLNIGLVIVDSYTSAMGFNDADPNSVHYARLAMALGYLGHVGVTALVVAHARKLIVTDRYARPDLGDIAGSYALGSQAATGLFVRRPDAENRMVARLDCLRAPDEEFRSLDIIWARNGEGNWTATCSTVRDRAAERTENAEVTLARDIERVIEILGQHQGPVPAGRVAKICGVSELSIGDMIASGLILAGPRGYTLSEAARGPARPGPM